METGTSIYGKVMKRVGINLPVDPHCLINCHGTTLYQIVDKLWNAVNTSVGVYDENAKALEEFTHNVAEWSAEFVNENEEFKSKIIAMLNEGGDAGGLLDVIGWNNFDAALQKKIQGGAIKDLVLDRPNELNGNRWILRLITELPEAGDLSRYSEKKVDLSDIFDDINSVLNGIFNSLSFEPGFDANGKPGAWVGRSVKNQDSGMQEFEPLFHIPTAIHDSEDYDDTIGLMTPEQARKLDMLKIEGNILQFGDRKFKLEDLHEIAREWFSAVVWNATKILNSTPFTYKANSSSTIAVSYKLEKTTEYQDGSTIKTQEPGGVVRYTFPSGSPISITTDANGQGTLKWLTENGSTARSVEVTATVYVTEDGEEKALGSISTTFTQPAKPQENLVFYGASASFPTTAAELTASKTLPQTEMELQANSQKCMWVAIPAGYRIAAWVDSIFKNPVSGVTVADGTITKDGKEYTVHYSLSRVAQTTNNLVTITK